jgi:transcriptional regulator with GAF, ATPase, and Fis domain
MHLESLENPGLGCVLIDGDARVLEASALAAGLLATSENASIVGMTVWSRLENGEDLRARLFESQASGGGGWAAGSAVIRGVAVRRTDRRVYVDLVFARAAEGCFSVAVNDSTMRVAAEGELARVRARLAETERSLARVTSLQQELVSAATPGAIGGETMIGSSPPLRRVKEQVARVAATNTTVLIAGETGAGKELVARSIHQLGARRAQAFVPVNCAALPETLIESELFGHEKGAFTGADRRRLGKFELADGGTLFLDEIAELPMQSQAKLLRVLQDSAFERVGGVETVNVSVRLIAATHRDLARQVERGRFREDLFYRLNVFRIQVPPLRERKEDLRALAEHIHHRIALRMGRTPLPLSERSQRRLMAYHWPGNVRELANAIERATLLADGVELDVEIPESPGGQTPSASGGQGPGQATRDVLLDLTLEQLQRLHITHALEASDYAVFGPRGAAKRLDINPTTLLSRMDKFGIPRPRLSKPERADRRVPRVGDDDRGLAEGT